MDFARILRGFCVGFARNLILFLFEREHEGYKRFADCTVFCHLHNCFKMCRQTSKQLSSLIWNCAVLFVYTYFKFVQNLRIIRVAECYNDNLFIFICRRMYHVCHLA